MTDFRFYCFLLLIMPLCGCGTMNFMKGDEGLMPSQSFIDRYQNHNNRKLVVFMDGTWNQEHTHTNIVQLYKLAQAKAKSTPIIPYYITGVGSENFNRIFGGVFGSGIDEKIKQAYKFIAENYKHGDEVFIFGFSRGAYSARSLNGLIEFGNLLDRNKLEESDLDRTISELYKTYNINNDGKFGFEDRLRARLQSKFGNTVIDYKLVVTAIGLFDTVPALGLKSDGFPDDHRTDLYAIKGFHALSSDEQRNAFKLLRFNKDKISTNQFLKEVWFAGDHADVGGGHNDIKGLESVARHWMLDSFCEYEIFSLSTDTFTCGSMSVPDYCSLAGNCAYGELHDIFLTSRIFKQMEISRRVPNHNDFIHGSVVCRVNKNSSLDKPNLDREPNSQYVPLNLKLPIKEYYQVIEYPCEPIN